jgi:hypothetical protein
MTYHHANRLVAHWQPKDLTATAKLVALHLAQNLQAEGIYAGRYFHSGDLLSKELGLDIKTTYRALGSLVAAGLFDAETIHRGTRLRTYSLALECPTDCQANNHYTALEIAGRVSAETEPIGKNALIDTPLIGKNAYTYRELTNKEDLDIDIETFTSFSVEKLDQIYFQVVSKTLASLETKTANHLLLDTALVVNPALVLVDARAVAAKAKNSPEAYLAKTTINSPESLLETFRAATSTEPAIDPRELTDADISLIRSAALDVIGERQNEQKLYNEYLLASGAISPELVEIIESQMNDYHSPACYKSLEEAVADALAIKHSIDVDLELDPSLKVIVYEGSVEPEASYFGADTHSYQSAIELHRKRQEWQHLFDAKQPEILDAYLKEHPEHSYADAMTLAPLEANEQARAANPELSVDREHYARLILTELHQLPAIETLADYLGGNESLNVATETIAREFLEFWKAYPSRPEGKGTKRAALKVWLEARKRHSHESLMSALRFDFNGSSPEYVKFPASWLSIHATAYPELEISTETETW